MNPKNVMTAMACITTLAGILFFMFATEITARLFPNVGEEAIMVGVFHRKLLAGSLFSFSIFFVYMRDAEDQIAKRFLFAAGLCFCVVISTITGASVLDGATALPTPSIVIFAIFAIVSFYVSTKKKEKDELIAEIKEQILDE